MPTIGSGIEEEALGADLTRRVTRWFGGSTFRRDHSRYLSGGRPAIRLGDTPADGRPFRNEASSASLSAAGHDLLASCGVEDELARARFLEVEHRQDRACRSVRSAVSEGGNAPVALNEAHY